jgi:predicted nucleic acid-binding protein
VFLIDTSAWVDHLRGADTAAARELRDLIRDHASELSTTEPIIMELLAGAPEDRALRRLEDLTNRLVLLAVDPRVDYHDAAALFRATRRTGRTVRKLVDCLIAAVAIRSGAVLVHKDADFDSIAGATPLNTKRLS